MPILGGIGNVSEYAYRPLAGEFPDFFDWPDVLNALPGTTYYSGYAKITGIKKPLRITITPGYSYSIIGNVFDNGQTVTFDSDRTFEASFDQYSDPNLRFTTASGRVRNNQSVILKLTTELTPSLLKTSFDATRFRFNDFNPRFDSINEPVNAFFGDFNTLYRPVVSVGKTTQDWIVQTKTLDQTPNSFSFVNVINQQTSSISTSNYVTITGLEPYYKFNANIIEGTASGISVDRKVALASTQVSNGSIINLETITSSDFNTAKNVQVRVGTFTAPSWTVTTETENLNITFTPIDFIDQTNLQLNTFTDSNQITLTGFSVNSSLPVTLSNPNTQYEVERNSSIVKSFDASPIEVINNDKVRLRLPSSSSFNTPVTTTMTVGNTSADWKITTRTAPSPGVTLTASSTTAILGQNITLTWSSTDATSVTSSNFGATAVSGSTIVTPTATTTYSITVSGPGGSATASRTITINIPPTASLTASPPSLLSCKIQGENNLAVFIDSLGDPTGVSLGLNAVNRARSCGFTDCEIVGLAIKQGKLFGTAAQSSLRCSNSSPSSCRPGGRICPSYSGNYSSSTLTWSSTNATSVTSSNFGATAVSGSTIVTPRSTTSYNITVSGSGGSRTASASVTVDTSPLRPTIDLSASSTAITQGESIILTWISTDTTSVTSSDFGATVVNGSVAVSPTSSRTYNITVSGPGGSATASVSVTVNAAPPPPAPTVTLTALSTTITQGQSTTLTWSSTNATSVTSSDFGATAVNGSVAVSPTSSRTYSITVSGPGGSATASASVTVSAPPAAPTVTLTASPTSITSGSSSTLTWSSTNATSVTSSNFSATTVNGTRTVSPTTSTTYSITVSGPGGNATSSATVDVSAPPIQCVYETRTSIYGTGFKGYLLYGNGSKEIATNGSDGFITGLNSSYPRSAPVTSGSGFVTTYGALSDAIINFYVGTIGRYPETIGFDGWINEFRIRNSYTSLSVLTNAINNSYINDGERNYQITKGGLVANYQSGTPNTCDIVKVGKLSCVVETRTSTYGIGFKGYLLYGNGTRTDVDSITGLNSSYPRSAPVTSGSGFVTTYGALSDAIINFYTGTIGRYPEAPAGFDGWINDFRNGSYSSLQQFTNIIDFAYRISGGERDITIARGGLVGNYDNCNNKRV